jgi:diguanylate cyclase (GGDEF)-like protein
VKNQWDDRNGVLRKVREIIEEDPSIAAEKKEDLLKLIQVLMDSPGGDIEQEENEKPIRKFSQEVISRHPLMKLVKHQADELDALKRISLNLTSSLDLQTVLDVVVAEAMHLVKNASSAHIFLYTRGALEFGASLNAGGDKNQPSTPRYNGLTYSVANSGTQIVIEDVSQHPLYDGAPAHWQGSIIGIPLKFKDNILGVMNLAKNVVGHFSHSELRLISLLADQAAVAIYNASILTRATQLANTDSVTGLPNRRALDERLQEEWLHAKRNSTSFSVVMMDLDGFKTVNDTFGHDVGDELLHSLFNFLAGNIRTSDFLARYGGDELTLVMHNTDLSAAETVTKKMIDLMIEYRFSHSMNTPLKLGMTAGIATYPNHAQTPSDLLRAADAALYHAKKYYRGTFAVAKGVTGMLNSGRVKEQEPPESTN